MNKKLVEKLYFSRDIFFEKIINKYEIKFDISEKDTLNNIRELREYLNVNEISLAFELLIELLIQKDIIVDIEDCFCFYSIINIFEIDSNLFNEIKFQEIIND